MDIQDLCNILVLYRERNKKKHERLLERNKYKLALHKNIWDAFSLSMWFSFHVIWFFMDKYGHVCSVSLKGVIIRSRNSPSTVRNLIHISYNMLPRLELWPWRQRGRITESCRHFAFSHQSGYWPLKALRYRVKVTLKVWDSILFLRARKQTWRDKIQNHLVKTSAWKAFFPRYNHLQCWRWMIISQSAKLLQWYPTMNHSLPGSSVHGILQARILEGVAMPASRGPSRPGDRACFSYVSALAEGS